MTAIDTGRRKLDLGRVFGDTFGVIRRQAAPLLGVSFVLSYLPSFASSALSTSVLRSARPTPIAPFAAFSQPLTAGLGILVMLLTVFTLAFQLDVAIGELEGRSRPLPEALRAALGKVLPMLGAALLVGLGVGLGFIFLIVPGAILAVMWVVALPVVAADTANPIRALGRSRALTKGNRWRIFGLTLLVWLVVIVVEGVFFGVAAGMGAIGGGAGLGLPGVAFVSLFSFAFSLLLSVGSAALYVQLRELKGGGGEAVAQVFA